MVAAELHGAEHGRALPRTDVIPYVYSGLRPRDSYSTGEHLVVNRATWRWFGNTFDGSNIRIDATRSDREGIAASDVLKSIAHGQM